MDKRNHSSSETSPGLGLKVGATWRRQGVVSEASNCHEKVFSSLCIPSVYLTFVAVRKQGRGGRERL